MSNTIAMGEIGSKLDRRVIGQVATRQFANMLRRPSLCLSIRNDKRPDEYASSVEMLKDGRGGRWADGAAPYGLFNTILPPNSPSCAVDGPEAADGYYASGSFHEGGVQVVFADGAVRFITESIDCGDSTTAPPTKDQYQESPTPSPYGIWGALGSTNGLEQVSDHAF
jgi:prepilin-type processing-associated H-X9-DG protein